MNTNTQKEKVVITQWDINHLVDYLSGIKKVLNNISDEWIITNVRKKIVLNDIHLSMNVVNDVLNTALILEGFISSNNIMVYPGAGQKAFYGPIEKLRNLLGGQQ